MKKILSILFLLVSFAARSQSVVPLRADTIKIYKVGGPAELVLQNATKDTTGFLYNTGNGVTKFLRGLRKINDSTYLIGPDTLKIHASGTSGTTYTAAGYSITVSGDTLKLVNDLASPGNSKYYGTNSIGTRSWLSFNYDSLTNKPTIPAQFNPAVGLFLAQSGSYPNITTRVDTGSASAYYLRRKDSTAGGYYPYSSNPLGYITSIDTGGISNFSVKVRSLFSVTAPLIYNSATGQFSLDTASGKQRSENYYNTKFASSVGNLSPLFTSSLSAGTISYSLTNASGFTLFGRSSGSGAPSYLASIDSNWVPSLHSQNYYDARYSSYFSPTLLSVTGNGDSTTYRIVSNDTIKSDFAYIHGKTIFGDSVRSNKSAIFIGHSVVANVGVSNPWEGFAWKTADLFGLRLVNKGIAGTTVRHHSAGDSCFLDRLYTIPNYSGAPIFIMYDINDANASYGFDTTGYKTDYGKCIDTLLINRGYPNNKVVLLSANYVDTSVTNNYDNIRHFVRASRTVAEQKGIAYVDLFYSMERAGGSYYLSDEDHPNYKGTSFISGKIAKDYTAVKQVGDVLVNGGINGQDTSRFVGAVRIGTVDTATVDGIEPALSVFGRTYLSSKVYFNTKYDLGVDSWLNIVAQTNKPGIYIKDGNPYTSSIAAGTLQQSSFGSISTFHGKGITTDQTNGFNLIGSGGSSYFFLENDHSVFGNSNVGHADLDSTHKVKGGFHVTGGFRHSGVPSASDTTTYKPYGINSSGQTVRMSYWPGSGGGGGPVDTSSISNFSVKVRSLFSVTAPLIYNSATGQFSLDTASGKQRSENYYNTKFASAVGNLSPLFTSSLSAGTVSYSLTNASGFTLFGRGTGSGAPSYLASIDSNWVPALHTEAYYNTKYAPIGGGGGGEVNTASNLGTGYGWYASKSGVDLRFKSLTTGVGIVATSNTNDIQIQLNGYQLWQADTVSTSNATTTTISTITLPGTGFMVYGTAEIIMTAGNTTKGLMGKKIIHFMCNSGTASVLDIIDDGADYLQGFTTATWTVTASGSTLLVRATGEAATSIEWVPLSKVKWTKYAL